MYKKENRAIIELVQIDQITKIDKKDILMFDENEVMEELTQSYISNIEKISVRFKLENIVFSNAQPMRNACLYRILEYYKSKGNINKMNEVIDINNGYEDIWKYMGK